MKNNYEILGVNENSDVTEIELAFMEKLEKYNVINKPQSKIYKILERSYDEIIKNIQNTIIENENNVIQERLNEVDYQDIEVQKYFRKEKNKNIFFKILIFIIKIILIPIGIIIRAIGITADSLTRVLGIVFWVSTSVISLAVIVNIYSYLQGNTEFKLMIATSIVAVFINLLIALITKVPSFLIFISDMITIFVFK